MRSPEGTAQAGADATERRILLAALESAALFGIARLSMADVAARAGLSRQTLYKRFASKDALVAAVVEREAAALVHDVMEAAAVHDEPRAALEAAAATALRLARAHPLLDRLVRSEPEALLPLISADGGPVTTLVRAAVEAVMDRMLPGTPDLPRRRLADLVTRLLISYTVNAPDDPPEVVAAAMAGLLVDGLGALHDPQLAAPPAGRT